MEDYPEMNPYFPQMHPEKWVERSENIVYIYLNNEMFAAKKAHDLARIEELELMIESLKAAVEQSRLNRENILENQSSEDSQEETLTGV